MVHDSLKKIGVMRDRYPPPPLPPWQMPCPQSILQQFSLVTHSRVVGHLKHRRPDSVGVRLPSPRSRHSVSRVAWWEGPLVHLTVTKRAKTSHQRLAICTTLSAVCLHKKIAQANCRQSLIGLKQYCILALSKMPTYTVNYNFHVNKKLHEVMSNSF